MVSFEIFVKAMPPSSSELKVLPSFCFAFKIPDDVAASTIYTYLEIHEKKLDTRLDFLSLDISSKFLAWLEPLFVFLCFSKCNDALRHSCNMLVLKSDTVT